MHIAIHQFTDGLDFTTQQRITKLYEGVFDFVPILHQTLVGNGLFNLYIARQLFRPDEILIGRSCESVGLSNDIVGAAILKTPEAVMPIGSDIQPLAWVISDVVTAPDFRRQGIGLRLARHLEGEVIKRGGRIIYLYTEHENEAAIRLYVKAGFRRLRPQGRQTVFAKLIEE